MIREPLSLWSFTTRGFPGGSVGKESVRNAGDQGSIPGSGRSPGERKDYPPQIPWRRERLPTPVFLPGEPHGQRSLAGYSPWGHKELDLVK